MSDTETITLTAADIGVLHLGGCTGFTPNLAGCACPHCQERPQARDAGGATDDTGADE